MSFTCVLSRNLTPPNLTKGMLRRVSSTSRARYDGSDDRLLTLLNARGSYRKFRG